MSDDGPAARGREPIRSSRLSLEPLRADAAQDLLAGGDGGVRAGKGWPHADTLDPLSVERPVRTRNRCPG